MKIKNNAFTPPKKVFIYIRAMSKNNNNNNKNKKIGQLKNFEPK
jgi:hypothetical protein